MGDFTNSTLPEEEHPIDAVTVGRDVCYCLIGMMGIVGSALLIRKIAKRFFGYDPCAVVAGSRNAVVGMTDSSEDESEENDSIWERLGVEIGEEALPDDDSSDESGSNLDQAPNFSTIRLPRYTSVMSLVNRTPDRADSPPSYELATTPLPSYEEATTIEVAENDSERAQPPTYVEATMVEINENLV